jgi:ABC-type nitrate/sulfonate/bicarbonate transport system substrate-binding protein
MSSSLHELRVIAFPGAPNLPVFAAMGHGFFAENGISVDLTTTPSSVFQFVKFAEGAFDIAMTAYDNVVAYSEGQGAVQVPDDFDMRVIMGATQIELAFVTQPDVKTYADIKGRTLALDALATGFAFVLYEMLADGGLTADDYTRVPVGSTPKRWESVRDGEHAGTLTIEPFTSIARARGFNVLDVSSRLYPDYQGGVVGTRPVWARANGDAVRGFIRGYLKGLEWVLDPQNSDAASALLLAKMPAIKPGVVGAVMKSLLSPKSGLTPKGAILREGMKTVLDLRSAHGKAGAPLTDIDKYLDLSFYQAATYQAATN